MTSIFQRGMAHILGDLAFVSFFIDDIVVYSDSLEEHAQHLIEVVKRLTAAKLMINQEKCKFCHTRITLLGFVIDRNGKRISKERVANIHKWAPPTNAKMIQRYLGMFNYFREYIPCMSTLTAPLDQLRNTKK